MTHSIIDDREQERQNAEEERAAAAERPSELSLYCSCHFIYIICADIEVVLEETRKQQAEQSELQNAVGEGKWLGGEKCVSIC